MKVSLWGRHVPVDDRINELQKIVSWQASVIEAMIAGSASPVVAKSFPAWFLENEAKSNETPDQTAARLAQELSVLNNTFFIDPKMLTEQQHDRRRLLMSPRQS